jgi:hypothetical protein
MISRTWQKPEMFCRFCRGRANMGVPRRRPEEAMAERFDGCWPAGDVRAALATRVTRTARAALAPHCPSNLHANITVNVLRALARGVIE